MSIAAHIARAGAHLQDVTFSGADTSSPGFLKGAQNDAADDSREKRPEVIRLLVVDDDDVDRERVHRLLARSRLACEIVYADSGRSALDLLQRDMPDCILLDHNLGDMTGIDLVDRLNRDGILTPVIMITGQGDERLVVQAMRLGVYDYLPKRRLNQDKLSDAIEASIKQAALQRRLAEMQKQLERMSLRDELTGLANRNLFFDRLNQAVLNAEREGAQFALLMMDLNLFKEVNDNFGHEAGDRVLTEIGKRFRAMSRKSDTIARLGGDEFTCIPHGVDCAAGAIAYAEKIVQAVNEPIAIGQHIVQVGVSIGIALYPRHGIDASKLLCNADHAMYQAKNSLRSYMLHDDSGQHQRAAPAPVGSYLHKAIEEQELYLVYQPEIDLVTGNVVGVEALVRWRSPELGAVLPEQFIPFAERSALIEKISFATLHMALDQLSVWRQQGRLCVPVSVNLSARMLDDAGLPARIMNELHARGLQPSDLMLEITETALASSSDTAKQVLTALAASGVGISIDDFGTGFTSFKYIRDIDIHEIKIDRLFIENLAEGNRDMSIVRSLTQLCEAMDVRVVAEGIESEQARSLLKQLGCRRGQGFSIAHPMVADEFVQWLQT